MPKEIKFSIDEINEIKRLYNDKISCKDIGKQFKCSKQTINKLLSKHNVSVRSNSDSHKIYEIDECVFENIDTHEKAYWLGILAGDGCIYKNSIILHLQEKDLQTIVNFKKFLKCEHQIKKRISTKKDKAYAGYVISITNAKIKSDLCKYGIVENKTKTLEFPTIISDEFMPSYLLGLIDSDGGFCIKNANNNKRSLTFSFVGITNISETFQRILIDNCRVSKTKLYTLRYTPYLSIMSYSGYKNIYKIVKFIYDKCPVFMDRKKDIAISFLLSKNIYHDDEWLLNHYKIKSI